jgi:conjugal transfer mating pair stabilization protein TraN
MKILLLLLGFLSVNAFAQSAFELRDNALQRLKSFNPKTAIQHYNDSPVEASLGVEQNMEKEYLEQLGRTRLSSDETGKLIYHNQQNRADIKANDKSSEMKLAEKYIEASEDALHGNCHWEKGPCEEKITHEICEEKNIYESKSCQKNIIAQIKQIQHPEKNRVLNVGVVHDLGKCSGLSHEYLCHNSKLLELHPNCSKLELQVFSEGQLVPMTKYPSCADPTFILGNFNNKRRLTVVLKLKEFTLEQTNIDESSCDFVKSGQCFYQGGEPCMDAGMTKIIDGVAVTRACWGESLNYQCVSGKTSNCEPLLDKGCSNTESKCLSQLNGACDDILRTFQCVEQTCYPDKKVCTDTIACADGSCDLSQSEESNDINDGISKLGALAGVANEVATNQVQNNSAAIFRGEKFVCEKYPLSLRDCCTDSGFLDGIIHCPRELQDLQKAKVDGRVALVGDYQDAFYKTKKFVYCVFPSKLAGIVQIQGRLGQLGISFGKPKEPNCRGISPQELERINFSALNLSPIVHELKSYMKFIDPNVLEQNNQKHIEELNQKGVAHD